MVTEFEMRVLKMIVRNGRIPTGNKLIKYVSAARRLEKKGLAVKGLYWYATTAGHEIAALQAGEAKG